MTIPYPLPLARQHRTTGYTLRPVYVSGLLRSAIGFPVSPVNSIGDHWALEIETPAVATLCGRALLADLVRGGQRLLRVPIPQRGIDVGSPGSRTSVSHSDGAFFSDGAGYAPIAPRVDGDGQSGSTLNLIGVTPGYVVKKGLFFTLETASGSSAHLVTDTATADDAGRAIVSFWPMLWRDPSDRDRIEMFEPYIEGLVVDQGGQASGIIKAVRTEAFTIEEAA